MAQTHDPRHFAPLRRTARSRPLRALRWALHAVQTLLVLLAFYCAGAIVLGMIPRNAEFKPVERGVEIFLTSNGVHADIAVPVDDPQFDWRRQYPAAHFPHVDERSSYVSIGWGDRGFYLSTERWADLTAGTAAVALLGIGSPAMHVEYVGKPRVDDATARLLISPAQYAILVDYIRRSAMRSSSGEAIPIAGHHYGNADAFFEANGTYSLFKTSNEWVREGLQEAGVRVPLWAPFDTFLFYQLR